MRGQDGVLVLSLSWRRLCARYSSAVDGALRSSSYMHSCFFERGIERSSQGWRRCCARGCTSARSTSASCTTARSRADHRHSLRPVRARAAADGLAWAPEAKPTAAAAAPRRAALRTCASRMVINSSSGNYRCGDTSANRVPTSGGQGRPSRDGADALRRNGRPRVPRHGRPSARGDRMLLLHDTIRQLGELGLLGGPRASSSLELTTHGARCAAHTVLMTPAMRAEGTEPAPRRSTSGANPRRTVSGLATADHQHRRVTVAPAMTADGGPESLALAASTSGSWDSMRQAAQHTSPTFADIPSYRTPHTTCARRAVRRRRQAQLPQPREATKRDRRRGVCEIRPFPQRSESLRLLLRRASQARLQVTVIRGPQQAIRGSEPRKRGPTVSDPARGRGPSTTARFPDWRQGGRTRPASRRIRAGPRMGSRADGLRVLADAEKQGRRHPQRSQPTPDDACSLARGAKRETRPAER